MHEVLVKRLGGLSLPSVVSLTDCPNMTLDVYRRLRLQYNNNKIDLGPSDLNFVRDTPSHFALSFCEV